MTERRRVFQDGDALYEGKDRRGRRVSDETYLAIQETIGKCFDKCNIPPKVRDNLGHLMGALEDIGDKDIGKGIDNFRDQYKHFAGIRSFNHKLIEWIVKTVLVSAILGALSAFVYGVIAKIRGEG